MAVGKINDDSAVMSDFDFSHYSIFMRYALDLLYITLAVYVREFVIYGIRMWGWVNV